MRHYLQSPIFFGVCTYILILIILKQTTGANSAVLICIVLGLMIFFIIKIQLLKHNKVKQKMSTYHLLFSGAVNYIKEGRGISGSLFLTENELIYKPYENSMQKYQMLIPLKTITEVGAYKNLIFISNGFLIKTADNTVKNFVVGSNKTWINKINQALHYE